VQGVQKVKVAVSEGKLKSANFVFIRPTDLPTLEKRLRDRGTESEENILKRLGNAQAEMDYGEIEGNFDFTLVNDGLEEAKEEIIRIAKKLYEL